MFVSKGDSNDHIMSRIESMQSPETAFTCMPMHSIIIGLMYCQLLLIFADKSNLKLSMMFLEPFKLISMAIVPNSNWEKKNLLKECRNIRSTSVAIMSNQINSIEIPRMIGHQCPNGEEKNKSNDMKIGQSVRNTFASQPFGMNEMWKRVLRMWKIIGNNNRKNYKDDSLHVLFNRNSEYLRWISARIPTIICLCQATSLADCTALKCLQVGRNFIWKKKQQQQQPQQF